MNSLFARTPAKRWKCKLRDGLVPDATRPPPFHPFPATPIQCPPPSPPLHSAPLAAGPEIRYDVPRRFMLITDATVILINTVDNIGTPSKQTTVHDADPASVD